MAPRKTDESIKLPIKRGRKPKSSPLQNNSLKASPDLKLQFSQTAGSNGTPEKFSKKPISLKKKIELANEVANAQLCRLSTTYPQDDQLPAKTIVENSTPKLAKGKRKLPATVKAKQPAKKKKNEHLISDTDSTSVTKTDSEDAFQLQPSQKIVKKKSTYKLIDCNGAGKAVTPDLLKQPRKTGRKTEVNSQSWTINNNKKKLKLSLKRKNPTKKTQETLEAKETPIAKPKTSTSKSQKTITSTPNAIAKARDDNETAKLPTVKKDNSVAVKKKTPAAVKRQNSTTKPTKTDKPASAVKSSPVNKRKPALPKKIQSSQLSLTTITQGWKKDPTVKSTTPSGKVTKIETPLSDSKQALPNNDRKAESVLSRKASINSNNSAFSWVQDISTSSNMTPRITPTITSQLNDFVCFDNKVPFVQMVNIDDMSGLIKKQERITPVSNELEAKEMSSKDSDSESSSSGSTESSSSSDKSNMGIHSPRLSSSSVSYGTNPVEAVDKNDDKITLALERMAISFQKFDRDMTEWMNNESTPEPTNQLSELGYDALKYERNVISQCRELYRLCKGPFSPEQDSAEPVLNRSPEDHHTQDEKNMSYEHDDDDALSLFAESITGIETLKLSSATVPTPVETPVQEYVPVPIANKSDTYVYRPTNITTLNPSPVCEKQSADSTSRADPFLAPAPPIPDTVVFRSNCFHNLVSKCPFQPCFFKHTVPTNEYIARALSQLDINVLKREHALLRKYPALKRYEPVFDAEIERRREHKNVINMDETLEEPLEKALQHLNGSVDNFGPALQKRFGNVWLCDAMLKALADTQNFSRFKNAFVKLALFVSENERSVSVDVATKILERVCILPAEVPIARAMLHILKLTSPSIYKNNMMGQFEPKLAGLDKSLYDEYLEAKPQPAVQPICSPLETEMRYTSPDTTHLDNLNNQPAVPRLTRTVDFNLSRTVTNYHVNGPRPNDPYNLSTWRRGSFQPRFPTRRPIRRPMHRPMGPRTYMRPPMNQRFDNFGYRHKYLPRPRTDF